MARRSKQGTDFFTAIFGNSPYLGHALLRDIPFLARLLDTDPDALFNDLTAESRAALASEDDRKRLMSGLRLYKRRAAALIGLADIFGIWPLRTVTAALSETAETAVSLALAHILRAEHRRGSLLLPDAAFQPGWDGTGSGMVILGMGKLGGFDLNYSSDIDLIVFYDEGAAALSGKITAGALYVRVTRELVTILEQRTADGYVFRTDLRLRPDPGATPLAVSVDTAEAYYGSLGQNWERAAMIRARPIAGGDPAVAKPLMRFLHAWVWRRHLDFAAIQDIHSIKRQIGAHRGHTALKIAGHNIKLGRGGIREIEFFIQTQQLIYGGRNPALREAATIDALDALVRAGWVEAEAGAALNEAYCFLRCVEHRLQMIEDRQTHVLPETDEGLNALALFLGFADKEAFENALTGHMRAVERYYADLFEEAPALSDGGSLVFTGPESDPDTLETLAQMGFAAPEKVAATVRGWHHGRYRATRSERARQLLTELMPDLLRAMADTPHPDTAFTTFDKFLEALPAGVQLLSLFQQNPKLMAKVATVMGTAPALSEWIAGRPALIDSLLVGEENPVASSVETLRAQLDRALGETQHYEGILDTVRRWASEKRFLAAMAMIQGVTDGDQLGRYLTAIAELSIAAITGPTCAEFAARHGDFGQPLADCLSIIALGKLGSRELSFGSDLDLVVVYRVGPDAVQSDGAKSLAPATYFTRLTQRLISALTAQTAEGRLYEVDLRLRPYGNDGPLAVKLDGMRGYYGESAWIWELMALTRARPITGSEAMRGAVRAALCDALCRPRDADDLAGKAAEMRRRIAETHRAPSQWQVKYTDGGLVDCEFTVQALLLAHAVERPDLLRTKMGEALKALADAGFIGPEDAEALRQSLALCHRVQAYQRLTREKEMDPAQAPEAMRRGLARAVFGPAASEANDFGAAEAHMGRILAAAHDVFRRIVLAPGLAHNTGRSGSSPEQNQQ